MGATKWPLQAALFGCLLLVVASVAAPAAQTAPNAESPPLTYSVIVTGGELLEGVYADSHTPFLTRALRPLGCQCVGTITVDDKRDDIFQALRFATNRAPLVIVTGGLGPTPNDITRETLSEFTGIPLAEHPEVLRQMERRFEQSRQQLRPNLRRQSLVPTPGGYFKNGDGTAVGLAFEVGGIVIVALPGPPRELQPMVESELIPFLQRRFGVREFGSSITLRFVGVGQSLIDQTIKDHIQVAPEVVITSLFETGRVDFTFSLPGHTAADRALLQRLQSDVREHLGRYIYANDSSSLEDVVVNKLRDRFSSIALVEVGTGGAVAAALNAARGGADLLAGAYLATSENRAALLLGIAATDLAHEPLDRAKQLAKAAAAHSRSRAALSIGPVQSDSKGNKVVTVALQLGEDRWLAERVPLGRNAEIARPQLTTQILDFLRQALP